MFDKIFTSQHAPFEKSNLAENYTTKKLYSEILSRKTLYNNLDKRCRRNHETTEKLSKNISPIWKKSFKIEIFGENDYKVFLSKSSLSKSQIPREKNITPINKFESEISLTENTFLPWNQGFPR